MDNDKLQLFEDQPIRIAWDEEHEDIDRSAGSAPCRKVLERIKGKAEKRRQRTAYKL